MSSEIYQPLVFDNSGTPRGFFHEGVEYNGIFPGEIVYIQTAMVGPRAGEIEIGDNEYKRNEFTSGREIGYQVINQRRLIRNPVLVGALAVTIELYLERPVFGLQSKEMPYKARDFIRVLSRPDALAIVAWEKEKGSQLAQRPVGYLIAERSLKRSDIPSRDRRTDSGLIARPPEKGALVFDTFAVATSRQGEQVGTTLVDLMLQWTARDARQLVTFAVDPDSIPESAQRGAYPWTMEMLLKHPRLKLEDAYHVRDYRGLEAYLLYMHILDRPRVKTT